MVDGWHIFDETGEILTVRGYDEVYGFNEGLAVVKQTVDGELRYGFIDTDGKEVVPPKYRELPSGFSEGFAVAWNGHSKVFLDAHGHERAAFASALPFSEGLAAVREKGENGQWGYVDRDFEWRVKPRFVAADSFSSGFAAVVAPANGRVGYVGHDGEFVVPAKYLEGFEFIGDYAPVRDEHGWYLIDRAGRRSTEIMSASEFFRGVSHFHGEWFGTVVIGAGRWPILESASPVGKPEEHQRNAGDD